MLREANACLLRGQPGDEESAENLQVTLLLVTYENYVKRTKRTTRHDTSRRVTTRTTRACTKRMEHASILLVWTTRPSCCGDLQIELLDSLTTRLEALMVASESESADALLHGRKGGAHLMRERSARLRAAAGAVSVRRRTAARTCTARSLRPAEATTACRGYSGVQWLQRRAEATVACREPAPYTVPCLVNPHPDAVILWNTVLTLHLDVWRRMATWTMRRRCCPSSSGR